MSIPGEDLHNSFAARDVVGWYNGIPWNADLKIDFSGETVAVFGQGNVAIDVARILLAPYKHLKVVCTTPVKLAMKISNVDGNVQQRFVSFTISVRRHTT